MKLERHFHIAQSTGKPKSTSVGGLCGIGGQKYTGVDYYTKELDVMNDQVCPYDLIITWPISSLQTFLRMFLIAAGWLQALWRSSPWKVRPWRHRFATFALSPSCPRWSTRLSRLLGQRRPARILKMSSGKIWNIQALNAQREPGLLPRWQQGWYATDWPWLFICEGTGCFMDRSFDSCRVSHDPRSSGRFQWARRYPGRKSNCSWFSSGCYSNHLAHHFHGYSAFNNEM